MVILNNKSPFVALMKTVEVLFLVRVFSFQHSLLATRLHFLILKFLLLTLANYEITLMINIINNINIFLFIYKVWFSTVTAFFLNSKALVFFQYPF